MGPYRSPLGFFPRTVLFTKLGVLGSDLNFEKRTELDCIRRRRGGEDVLGGKKLGQMVRGRWKPRKMRVLG